MNRLTIPTQRHSPLDHIFQFPHIPGKRITQEELARHGGKPFQRLIHLAGAGFQHMLRDDHDVLLPLAQGRNHDLHDVQAIKQIFPKPPLRHFLAKILLRRTNQAHIDVDPVVPSDALELPFLEHPQQLHLDDRRNFPDFVEEQGPAMRQLESSAPLLHRPGKGPLLVAKELRLQQGFRQGRATDLNQGMLASRAVLMDGIGHQLLACAALSQNQRRGIRAGHQLDLVEHRAHLIVRTEDAPEAELIFQRFLKVLILAPQRHHTTHPLDDQ